MNVTEAGIPHAGKNLLIHFPNQINKEYEEVHRYEKHQIQDSFSRRGRERNATGDREGPKWATDATQCLACKRHPVKRNYYNSSNYY